MDEIALIESIQRGNTHAFGILVDRYAKMCFSLALRVCQDSEDAEDIVQEGMIAAYQNITGFKKDSKFSTWLYKIVLNKALAAKKKQTFFDSVDNVAKAEEGDDLEMQIKGENQIKVALASLNEKERIIIDLYYFQEQSIREISEICQLTEANVKVLMHRARKKMFEAITPQVLNL